MKDTNDIKSLIDLTEVIRIEYWYELWNFSHVLGSIILEMLRDSKMQIARKPSNTKEKLECRLVLQIVNNYSELSRLLMIPCL